METIQINDFNTLINIVLTKQDYSDILKIAYDYYYGENPLYVFGYLTEEIDLFMNFVMVNDKPVNEDRLNKAISVIKDALNKSDMTVEKLIYILYYEEIQILHKKYNNKLISKSVYLEQIKKFNNGKFDINKLLILIEA